MKFTIPVYVNEQKQTGKARGYLYQVQPLFFSDPVISHASLQTALDKFSFALGQKLRELARTPDRDELARLTFHPPVEEYVWKFSFELAKKTHTCRLLVVVFEAFERRVAFSPKLPALWFDIERGESLFDRARDTLAAYFRKQFKDDGEDFTQPANYSLEGKVWVTSVEIFVNVPEVVKPEPVSLFAMLGAQQVTSGYRELHKVGRLLNRLYPDELDRAIRREREVSELSKLLAEEDQRPVAVVGPRMVGKTTIIHELVYRSELQRTQRPLATTEEEQFRGQVWLLSPQRLISGMAYVGQWEDRLIAILKEARRLKLVLYFDDLLGLFMAGQSSNSSLSVADVLKPYIERRDVRILAEITPESLRVLREKDRSLADLFHLLFVEPTNENETLEVVIDCKRQFELRHQCTFSLDSLPVVIDLQRRFVKEAVFPGKAAGFLRQLAVKHTGHLINRQAVLREFQASSGLSLAYLDDEVKLERKDIFDTLRQLVIGQEVAVNAVADVVSVAKAKLSDPTRPLAAMLFLGPTGVGKTHCAKVIARYLFGHEDKLLRFDMNEYLTPAAVSRLIGTFDQPEGLLTSAIRRQPFAVVLLDEIEKAHPDMFNLLLQVMGDGRLTDALGRTTDFSNAILILTSNLGVREAQTTLGFHTDGSHETAAYLTAAQKFFKPEFFNRLDRIIPFERLSRPEVERIAQGLFGEILHREGLLRRKATLYVDPRAMEAIISLGYHPQLGARALKRSLERNLIQPVAARLAALPLDSLTLISVLPQPEGFGVAVQAIEPVTQSSSLSLVLALSPAKDILKQVEQTVHRIEEEINALRPTGQVSLEAMDPAHERYFLVREHLQRVQRMIERGSTRLDAKKTSSHATQWTKVSRVSKRHLVQRHLSHRSAGLNQLAQEFVAASDVHLYLQEFAAEGVSIGQSPTDYVADIARETALLETLAHSLKNKETTGAIALFYTLNEYPGIADWKGRLANLYRQWAVGDQGLTVSTVTLPPTLGFSAVCLELSGALAYQLLQNEVGTHLVYATASLFIPIQLRVLPVGPHQSGLSVLLEFARQWNEALGHLASHQSDALPDSSPLRLLPIVRVYEHTGRTLDLRSELLSVEFPSSADLNTFVLSSLPLPAEVQG